MGRDHGGHQAQPVGQPAGQLVGGNLGQGDDAERRPQHLQPGRKAHVQPVGDHGVDHEAASQSIDREQPGEQVQGRARLRRRRRGLPAALHAR